MTNRGSILLVGEGDEGVPLAGVVGVHHLAVPLEGLLQLRVRHGLVDSVDEELKYFILSTDPFRCRSGSSTYTFVID